MKKSIKKEILSWTKTIIFAVVVAFICRKFIFAPITVQGVSMMPTFQENNKLIVSKLTRIDRSDMVVFHSPISNEDFIKRVIGLPGDHVEMKNDQLLINGELYKEPYLQENKKNISLTETLTEDFQVDVPKNYLFVMGDNRRHSNDSRKFGFIHEDSIIGEVKLRFFPIQKIGFPK